MMGQRDHTTVRCMELAMSATAYGNSRVRRNQKRLGSAINALMDTVPLKASTQIPGKEQMMDIVRSALSCGRAAGLAWHEMREIFNEETEKLPPALPVAVADLRKAFRGELVQ